MKINYYRENNNFIIKAIKLKRYDVSICEKELSLLIDILSLPKGMNSELMRR